MATATRTPLPFNPRILSWARSRRGLSVEAAAHAASVKAERIVEWESGTRIPTVRQGRMLADAYDRPFLEFFSKNKPAIKDVELVPDFRFHRARPSDQELIALREVQEWAEENRTNALSLIKDMGEKPPRLSESFSAHIHDNVDAVASRVRAEMDFTSEEQLSLKSNEKYTLPNIIRSKIEGCGVLVLKQSGLSKLRTRGICFSADPMPIVVYGNESAGAQAFTLSHEFAHILLGVSAISGKPRFGKKVTARQKAIEDWCNRFSAAFLMPRDILSSFERPPKVPQDGFCDLRLNELAKHFAVSRHAMMIRLVNLDYVASECYWRVKRPAFEREEEEYTPFGRSLYYGSRYVNSRGRFYSSLVLEAWSTGRITSHNAAEYMGIKNLSHLQDIRSEFGF